MPVNSMPRQMLVRTGGTQFNARSMDLLSHANHLESHN
jgi:hypothetical protein